MQEQRKRIWGWMMFDWAAQPFSTLLMTFIFAPYFADVVGDATRAQVSWGWMLTVAGIGIAICAPVLGAIADGSGRRMSWIMGFSVLYIFGSAALWFAVPGADRYILVLIAFGIGIAGMEFATIFTNALLPDLAPKRDVGVISGKGWALGYVGGVLALVLMLLFFAEGPTGKTLIGADPAFGLNPDTREGTRFVGPFTALWFILFMIPFFVWVKDTPHATPHRPSLAEGLAGLARTLKSLPQDRSLLAYLASSMFYRDALTGVYAFGGFFAAGVLGWSVVQMGTFGIIAALAGAVMTWAGGYADRAFGPKRVIAACCVVLIVVLAAVLTISRDGVLFWSVPAGSNLPDIAFYICGSLFGGVGGILGAASRTMMVNQGNPDRMTEAFGLFALTGKVTAPLAPLTVTLAASMTGSQHMSLMPLIVLFFIGLVLLRFVTPKHP